MEVAALEELLKKALEPNTQIVREAGLRIKKFLSKPGSIEALFTVLIHSQAPEVRQLGGVLLRKKIINSWSKLNESKQEEMKKGLLHLLLNDSSIPVRSAAANVISVLAKVLVPVNQWPELLQFLFECTQSPNANHRQMAMSLFHSITENIGEYLRPHFQTLQNIFQKGLQDPDSQVRIASLQAVGSLVERLETDAEMKAFKGLIPLMIQVIRYCIENDYEDEVSRAFEIFDNLIEITELPSVSVVIPEIIQFVLEVGGDNRLELGMRERAMTFVEWVIRYRPKMITKLNLVAPIFQVAFPMCAESDSDLTSLPTDANQSKTNQFGGIEEEDQLLSAHKFGSQLIDLMATSLSSKFVFDIGMKYVGEYISSSDAGKRRAGITALAVMSEGCADKMSSDALLPQELECIYAGFKDPNYRIREASCVALGQFSRYLQPNIMQHASSILPLLFSSLADSTEQVRMGSCYAIEAFCEELEWEQIEPYVEPLITQLVHVLQSSQNKQVQELALSAINATVAAAKRKFLKYAGMIAPMAMELMKTEKTEFLSLRCRATECIGILGNCIGREAFEPFILPSMELAVGGCNLEYEVLREYTYGYFCNMAEMLEADFVPFLPKVLPYILASCKSEDGVSFNSKAEKTEEEEAENYFNEDSDDDDEATNFQVRTAFLDEKSSACYALGVFADKCGPGFLQYLDDATSTLLSLHNYFHEDVRIATLNSLKNILFNFNSTFAPEGQIPNQIIHPNTSQFLDVVMPIFIDTITQDEDPEVVENACQVVGEVFKALPLSALEKYTPPIFEAVFQLLKSKGQCQTKYEEEDDDEEDAKVQMNLVFSSFDLITTTCIKLGPHTKNFFTSTCQHLGKYTASESPEYRAVSIGVLADLSNSMGGEVIGYLPQLMEVALKGMADSDPEARSNSTFFAGVLLQHGGIGAYQYYPNVLAILANLFQDQSIPNIVDNVCAAIARMIDTAPQIVPLDKVIPPLLEKLPLKEDMVENKTVYNCLLKLFQAGNPHLISNLGLLVSSVGRALNTELEQSIKEGLARMLQSLASQQQSTFETILNTQCTQPEREAIVRIFSPQQ